MFDIDIVVFLWLSRWRFWWNNGEMVVFDWLFGIGEISLCFYMGYMFIYSFLVMVDWREFLKCEEE